MNKIIKSPIIKIALTSLIASSLILSGCSSDTGAETEESQIKRSENFKLKETVITDDGQEIVTITTQTEPNVWDVSNDILQTKYQMVLAEDGTLSTTEGQLLKSPGDWEDHVPEDLGGGAPLGLTFSSVFSTTYDPEDLRKDITKYLLPYIDEDGTLTNIELVEVSRDYTLDRVSRVLNKKEAELAVDESEGFYEFLGNLLGEQQGQVAVTHNNEKTLESFNLKGEKLEITASW